MARQGFARCALGLPWRYLSAESGCRKQAPLPAEQEAARVRWAEGLSKKPKSNGG